MTTEEVLREVRAAIARHKGSERDLYEKLTEEAEGWSMRLEELEEEEDAS